MFIAFYSLLACVILTSCSLFIDEEDEAIDYGDVPVHTGQGYDTPAKATESGCDVTYQFKKDVRNLTEQDLQFVTYVRNDETGALVEIHYAGNTPQELLPVPGEILVSGVNDKFEWGCCHRLQNRIYENGVYKYLGTGATLKEVYEVLELNGQLTTEQEERYTVMEVDTTGAASNIRTRASDGEDDEESCIDVEMLSDGFSIKVPVAFNQTFEGGSAGEADLAGQIKMAPSENYSKITIRANFSDFSLRSPIFQLIKTVEEKTNIELAGTVAFTKRLHRWHPVKGKPFTIGPVVIVFFMDIDTFLELNTTSTASFKKYKHIEYTYTVNLYEGTCTEEKRVIKDNPLDIGAELSGEVAIELDVILGFGFYGKVFSVRFVPYLRATITATAPPIYKGIFDASQEAGVEFAIYVGGKIQFMIDFSWNDLFGNARDLSEAQYLLDVAADYLDEHSERYQEMKNDKSVQDFAKGNNDEKGVTIDIGPWKPLSWDATWFPKISDDSFTTTKYFADDGSMGVHAQYTIKGLGILGTLGGDYFKLCPALRITRGKGKSQHQVNLVYPEEGGQNAKAAKGSTYHFIIPQMDLNKEYNAQICYIKSGETEPMAVDKSLPFTFYSPAVIIESVEPVGLEENPEGWGKEGKYFCYLFKVDSRVKVEGAKALATWGVKDQVSGTTNSKSKNNANKDKDGIWTLHWYLKTCTNTPVTLKKLEKHLDLYPYYRLETNDDNKRGNHYEIKVYSNGTYDIIDDGEGFSATGLTYDKSGGANVKRMLSGTGGTSTAAYDTDTGAIDEMWIESIEDPDGNIIYENPKNQRAARWI